MLGRPDKRCMAVQIQSSLQLGIEASMPAAAQELEKSSEMLGLPGTIMSSARAQELQQPLIKLQVPESITAASHGPEEVVEATAVSCLGVCVLQVQAVQRCDWAVVSC